MLMLLDDHPNVIKQHALFHKASNAFLVLEKCDMSLRQALQMVNGKHAPCPSSWRICHVQSSHIPRWGIKVYLIYGPSVSIPCCSAGWV